MAARNKLFPYLVLGFCTGLAGGPVFAQSRALTVLNRGDALAATTGPASAMANRLAPPQASDAPAMTLSAARKGSPGVRTNQGAGAQQGGAGSVVVTSRLAVTPRAFGEFGIPYASGRVQGGTSAYPSAVGPSYLSTTAPYNRIGKLFFSTGSGQSFCSASLIRRSVIVTAAHCIQAFGAGASTYGGWVFVPGHYGGTTAAQRTPYGSWGWSAVSRPSTWADGTDTGDGAARNNDLAVIILTKNASNQFLGDVLGGWLGYAWNDYSFTSSPKTGGLAVAATTTLGYPALMDNGDIMQRADGPSYLTEVGGAAQIWQGSNFTGGSSGGPWIVNFAAFNPKLSGGAVLGSGPQLAVIGVTSWGSANPNDPKDNYSSRFGQNAEFPGDQATYGGYGAGNIGALLQNACNQTLSSGVTYANAGYCD